MGPGGYFSLFLAEDYKQTRAKHAVFLEINTLTWNRLPQDVLVQGDEDGGMAVTQGPQPQGQVTLAEQVIGHVHPVCNGEASSSSLTTTTVSSDLECILEMNKPSIYSSFYSSFHL